MKINERNINNNNESNKKEWLIMKERAMVW